MITMMMMMMGTTTAMTIFGGEASLARGTLKERTPRRAGGFQASRAIRSGGRSSRNTPTGSGPLGRGSDPATRGLRIVPLTLPRRQSDREPAEGFRQRKADPAP